MICTSLIVVISIGNSFEVEVSSPGCGTGRIIFIIIPVFCLFLKWRPSQHATNFTYPNYHACCSMHPNCLKFQLTLVNEWYVFVFPSSGEDTLCWSEPGGELLELDTWGRQSSGTSPTSVLSLSVRLLSSLALWSLCPVAPIPSSSASPGGCGELSRTGLPALAWEVPHLLHHQVAAENCHAQDCQHWLEKLHQVLKYYLHLHRFHPTIWSYCCYCGLHPSLVEELPTSQVFLCRFQENKK